MKSGIKQQHKLEVRTSTNVSYIRAITKKKKMNCERTLCCCCCCLNQKVKFIFSNKLHNNKNITTHDKSQQISQSNTKQKH